MKTHNPLLAKLRHHVTGAIERGEATAIVELPATAQHTPGPWTCTNDGKIPVLVGAMVSKTGIAVVGNGLNGGPLDFRQVAANARLIAAAPDLVAALEYALPYVEYRAANPLSGVQTSSARADVAIVRAALAKAKGDQ